MTTGVSAVCLVTAALALMGCGGWVQAADWAQWRGPNRDGHVPVGEKVPTSLPAEIRPLWRIPVGEGFSSPVVAAGRVFYSDLQDGQEVVHGVAFKAELAWTSKELMANFASPVAADGHIYGVGPRKNVYCAEARTGKLAWSQTGLIRGSGERAFATFLVMGKNILMLSDSGELVLFAASPAKFEPAGRLQACGVTWCSTAYADGRLYLRDANSLFCFDLTPS